MPKCGAPELEVDMEQAPLTHRGSIELDESSIQQAAEEAARALEEARVELAERRAQMKENAMLDELLQSAAEAVFMEAWDVKWNSMKDEVWRI
jgi:hypothetical protein